jgi:acyl-CoA hydrolase
MRFASYGAIGRLSHLADQDVLDVLPERYGRLAQLFEQGRVRADVVLLQATMRGSDGRLSCGLANDYVLSAARRARCVLVEMNAGVPWTLGTEWPADLRVAQWVRAEAAPLEVPPVPGDASANAIARHLAQRIPDGATLQVGVGGLPDAMLRGLAGHAGLGIHSGVLGDAGKALMQSGAVDNSRKGSDAGVTVTNTVIGSRSLYDFVHENPAIAVRPASYTHAGSVLGRLRRFHGINGALEVDLSGQANCEAIGGKRRGGIGGLLDFARAARQQDDGCSIIVLPATAAGGKVSRIVARLQGPATIGRADADVVITEHGIADLRDVSLQQRAKRLAAIAAPQFREQLAREAQG